MLVLVADKDPYDLDALKAGLEADDCEVVTTADGPVVLKLASSRSPDAVVAAASLGRMGGFAVSRELKRRSDSGEIREPVVIVLLEREADSWLAAWSRCDAWLTEPVDPADVDQLVRDLLASKV